MKRANLFVMLLSVLLLLISFHSINNYNLSATSTITTQASSKNLLSSPEIPIKELDI